MEYKITTDIGKKRNKNEDFYYAYANSFHIFIIADGMGGYKGGHIASKVASNTLGEHLKKYCSDRESPREIMDLIYSGFQKANEKVIEIGLENKDIKGLGTTLTLIFMPKNDDKIYCGHIGDSRVYLYNNGNLDQITEDHSYVQELLKAGEITENQVFNHPKKNIVTKALGSCEKIKPDIFNFKNTFDSNSYLLMCTDGLSNALNIDDIKSIIDSSDDLGIICSSLVEKANTISGADNITVILVKGLGRCS